MATLPFISKPNEEHPDHPGAYQIDHPSWPTPSGFGESKYNSTPTAGWMLCAAAVGLRHLAVFGSDQLKIVGQISQMSFY